MTELQTIYDCERAKFNGFGTYTLPIEERVNEIIEMTKKEFLPANKALVANKETLIYMTDDCNGVGMYYLKLKTIENTK